MAFQIKIVNSRKGDEQLNVLLTAQSVTGLHGLEKEGVSTPLSRIPDGIISMEYITSGRIYVGCGPLTNPPEPGGDQYYGWIEFSKVAPDPANNTKGDEGVWINLTNVDMTGLPLTLAGKDLSKKPFSLGYTKSMNDINNAIQADALTTPNEPAVIKCRTGQTKILAPNKVPGSYEIEIEQDGKTVRQGAFDQYLAELSSKEAKLVIQSDKSGSEGIKMYVGSFLNAQNDTDPIISLVNKNGDPKDTFVVLKGQFTSRILFECDGGTLIYQGKKLPQNNVNEKDDSRFITNSVFRNLLIGMNEGYFVADKVNYSNNFPFLTPFGKRANKFAEILHQSSNSYGFPYADSNLKVLITADPETPIILTAIDDDATFGYSNDEVTANMPNGGDYSFVIGANSDLGVIRVGNCRYVPSETGAYSGKLPTVDDWTKMIFGDENHYIWFKTTGDGMVVAQDCFTSGPPFWREKQLIWGSEVKWRSNNPAPDKPTDEADNS